MNTPNQNDLAELGFVPAVQASFRFLNALGYVLVAGDDLSVHYASDCARLAIRHDPLSFELSLQLGRSGHPDELTHPYSLQDLIRIHDSELAAGYRDFSATSPGAVVRGLQRLATDLRRFGEAALKCDPGVFRALASARTAEIAQLAAETRRVRADAAAREAFAKEDWERVIELYESRTDSLDPSQAKRLAIARRRSSQR